MMFSKKLSVLLSAGLGLLALPFIASADYSYREVRVSYLNTLSVSHLTQPSFLVPQTPVSLDLAEIFHQRSPFQFMSEQSFSRELASNEALASAVRSYAGILDAMVDAINASTQNKPGAFFVSGLPAKELLQRLSLAVTHDSVAPEGTAVRGLFSEWRVEESGSIRVGGDPLLQGLGLHSVECSSTPPAHVGDGVEFPLPLTACVFQR